MKFRLLVKLVFILAILLFMVLMGMSNKDLVQFKLDIFGVSKTVAAAIMYFSFFGAGVLCGAVLSLGGHRSASSSKSGK